MRIGLLFFLICLFSGSILFAMESNSFSTWLRKNESDKGNGDYWLKKACGLMSINNKITKIPSDVSEFTDLQLLSLPDNRLENLPAEIKNISKLGFLVVKGNPIPGTQEEFVARYNLTHVGYIEFKTPEVENAQQNLFRYIKTGQLNQAIILARQIKEKSGWNPNHLRDAQGDSPLHYAVMHFEGQPRRLLNELLVLGADPAFELSLKGTCDKTPIELAVIYERQEALKYFVYLTPEAKPIPFVRRNRSKSI